MKKPKKAYVDTTKIVPTEQVDISTLFPGQTNIESLLPTTQPVPVQPPQPNGQPNGQPIIPPQITREIIVDDVTMHWTLEQEMQHFQKLHAQVYFEMLAEFMSRKPQ